MKLTVVAVNIQTYTQTVNKQYSSETERLDHRDIVTSCRSPASFTLDRAQTVTPRPDNYGQRWSVTEFPGQTFKRANEAINFALFFFTFAKCSNTL